MNNGGRSELADIILNEEQKELLKEAENYNGKRAVIADLSDISDLYSKPWTNGIIPYVMNPKIAGECCYHIHTSIHSVSHFRIYS